MSIVLHLTLPETNSEFTPEKGWLEDDPFLLGWPIFRGYVKLREGIIVSKSVKVFFCLHIFDIGVNIIRRVSASISGYKGIVDRFLR